MSGGESGQFKPVEEKQAQSLPGREQDLAPKSEPTKLEGKNDFQEYRAAKKLEGSKALITGGDSGIGRSVAVLFAREGADVTIVYLPDEQDDAEETKQLVEKEGKDCLLVAGNLMENDTCKNAVQQHVDKFGKIHILVNNAAKQVMCEDFRDINLDDVESTFRSNILQIFAITNLSTNLELHPLWGAKLKVLSTRLCDHTSETVTDGSSDGVIQLGEQAIAPIVQRLLQGAFKLCIRSSGPSPFEMTECRSIDAYLSLLVRNISLNMMTLHMGSHDSSTRTPEALKVRWQHVWKDVDLFMSPLEDLAPQAPPRT
ncbi:general stress protein [Verticillium alfalfae VaMs.102]|uniref:General stress protein n=1 Tax=Verticillium alfalfae (strain VaMs.102 / ATCC MYA-4576 / FGSC 10136) TaxID=526221 RepID=C9SLF1_VERA1|nr:general stress protein [Verticillium alfalfae VaMs.102]EEY19519.1 general stress protein [Verticillium alfalfae VaMs.102]